MHSALEKDIKNTSGEYRALVAQFKVMERDFGKHSEIREMQDGTNLQIENLR
jgi:hypothetical protein